MSQSFNTHKLEVGKGGLPPLFSSEPIDLEFNPLPALVQTMSCPACPQENDIHPIDEFGICRARKSGRNLYCKTCIREKISRSRRELKAWLVAKRARQQLTPTAQPSLKPRCLPPIQTLKVSGLKAGAYPFADRILEAIRRGYHSYDEIEATARRHKHESLDEFGDEIARLLLQTREIRAEGEYEERRYYLRGQESNSALSTQHSALAGGFAPLGGIVSPKSNFTVTGPRSFVAAGREQAA